MRSDKWWYRLLQVVYVAFIFFLILFWVAGMGTEIPEPSPYYSTYQMRCDDGTYRGNFGNEILGFGDDDFMLENQREYARFVCAHTDLQEDELSTAYAEAKPTVRNGVYLPVDERRPSAIPAEKNYEIVILEQGYRGSWWTVAGLFFGGIISITLVSSLIRAVVLYILFKEPFWRTLFLSRTRK